MRAVSKHGYPAVRSDEGYEVWLRGSKGIRYKEGDYALRIWVVQSAVEVPWVVYFDNQPHWLPPHEGEPIDETKGRQIKERVISALNFMKVPCRLAE